jgi:hypothetical protein
MAQKKLKPLMALPEGKERVRPVKAVLLRWIATETTVDDILAERSLGLAEWTAVQFVKNVKEAKAGTPARRFCLEALRTMLDGAEDSELGIRVPVTLIDRVTQTGTDEPVRTQEVHQQVQLRLSEPEEYEDDGQREDADSTTDSTEEHVG